MPRPRGTRSSVEFQVSAWNSRKRLNSSDEGSAVPTCQTVVLRDLSRGHAAHHLERENSTAKRPRLQQIKPEISTLQPEFSNADNWVPRRGAPSEPEPKTNTLALGADAGDNGDSDFEQDVNVELTLEGYASLAILPCGNMSGHLVLTESRQCLGITGATYPRHGNCLGSEDSAIVHLTLINFSTDKELDLLASKTGGDLCCLSNTNQLTGDEKASLTNMLRASCTNINIEFQAEHMFTDDKAEKYLQKHNPTLCSKGAVVNQGAMTVAGLPGGFLNSVLSDETCESGSAELLNMDSQTEDSF